MYVYKVRGLKLFIYFLIGGLKLIGIKCGVIS